MNYEAKDYDNLLHQLDAVLSCNSAYSNLNLKNISEDSLDDFKGIENDVSNIGASVEKSCSDLSDSIISLAHTDLQTQLANYIELLNSGYEEDTFPFYSWLGCLNHKNWRPQGHWLLDIMPTKFTDENLTIVMRNIVSFYDEVSSTHPKLSYYCLTWCLDAINKLPPEHQESFKNAFLFYEKPNSFINSLENKSKPIEFKNEFGFKSARYLNYLFRPNQSQTDPVKIQSFKDAQINFIENLVSYLKLQPNSDKILNQLIDSIFNNFESNYFVARKSYNAIKVERERLLKLFEYDTQYDIGITPLIIEKLKDMNLEKFIDNDCKINLENIISELDKSYAVFKLNKKLPLPQNKSVYSQKL